ncbi:phytanoyl-CoA dioxygenase family protein [Aquimarina sp. D1M17]|uniref:phytanoyl-CoA dioxygenase family protein n=1 Tax=Aquimarina acroporae TaxID=2937283 RepID=UPI0020BEAF33|nr:phytanoyl-CoA dioxygenase family protein [Aquimarina acroporae]MCK8521745.1 phytanoyl-CoA dioxygenase family protein [Aquimarina acroporae]
MDYEKIAKDFWENGFVIFENFFENTMMDEYNEKILEHYGVNPNWEHTKEFISKSSVEVIPWFPYREGKNYFDGIDKHQTFNTITDHILKEGWQNLYCMMMFSKAGSKGQAWHQDCIPDDKKRYNLNRLVYTHDITEETGGAIAIFPKTHIEGRLSAGLPSEDLEGQLVFKPKKGTVIFLHGHCWHKVLPVKKDRISSNFRAVPKNTPEDITDICVYRNMLYKFSTSEVLEER